MGRNRPKDGTRSKPLAAQGPPGPSPPSAEDPPRPLWAPHGPDLDGVPDDVRRAAAEVVQPVYEQFVLDARDPLEKSLGVTLAHLLWLEILQQFDLREQYTTITAPLNLGFNCHSEIDQHLRIIESKVKVGYLLARLRECRRRWEEPFEGQPSLPGPRGPDPAQAASAIPPVLAAPASERDEH